jgi:hypothetical protein
MPETLEAVKDRISDRYLGKSGIHAIGLRRSANAITVYLKISRDPSQRSTLDSLRKEASPYVVIAKEAPDAGSALADIPFRA